MRLPNPGRTPIPPPSRPPESAAETAPLAGRGERLLAQILDNVIGLACALPGLIMMALAAARAGLGFGTTLDKLTTAAGFGAGLMVALAALLALAAVQLWMVVTSGQTIGKRVLGVRIVTFQDETNPGFVKVFCSAPCSPRSSARSRSSESLSRSPTTALFSAPTAAASTTSSPAPR